MQALAKNSIIATYKGCLFFINLLKLATCMECLPSIKFFRGMLGDAPSLILFCSQGSDGGSHPTGYKIRVTLGALAGVITGLCLAGPYGAIVGGAIGAGVEAWNKT